MTQKQKVDKSFPTVDGSSLVPLATIVGEDGERWQIVVEDNAYVVYEKVARGLYAPTPKINRTVFEALKVQNIL